MAIHEKKVFFDPTREEESELLSRYSAAGRLVDWEKTVRGMITILVLYLA